MRRGLLIVAMLLLLVGTTVGVMRLNSTRLVASTVRVYAQALTRGDLVAAESVAVGVAWVQVQTVARQEANAPDVVEVEVGRVATGRHHASAVATISYTTEGGSVPIYVLCRLARHKDGWRVYSAEPVDPQPSMFAVRRPISAAEQASLIETARAWLTATAKGDLDQAARYLAGRAWLSGEVHRSALSGRPIVPDGPSDVTVHVVEYHSPVAWAEMQYRLADSTPVRLLLMLSKVGGGHAGDPSWRIARVDPLGR